MGRFADDKEKHTLNGSNEVEWLSAASQCETQGVQGAMELEQLQVVERQQASRPLLKVAASQRHWTATWDHGYMHLGTRL